MAKKRGNRSRKKTDNVRFLVIKPKPFSRIGLSERLFQTGRTSLYQLESTQPNLSIPKRIVALLLAAIWFFIALAMIVLGLRKGKWLLVLIGAIGAFYGIGWVRVAHVGRLPGGRLRPNPWARG